LEKLAALPETGFVRLSLILALIPIGKSSWWAGIKEGRFPPPYKLGPRTTAWKAQDIRDLIERFVQAN
jgi:prophage regulatory protein